MKSFNKARYLFLGIGIISLCYWTLIHILYGSITFIHCFLLLGILSIGIFLLWNHIAFHKKLPKAVRRILIVVCTLGVILFGWEEITIISVGFKEDSGSGDTILILGAGLIHGEEISLSLQYRLEKGLSEHQKNPDALIIVSGGKGVDEAISEAAAMKKWLIKHHVDSNQILMEDQSHNTYENFYYTRKLMFSHHITSSHVTLITNRFHMRRARYLGEAQGFTITQKPAADLLFSEPCMYTREFFAMIKAYFFQ